MMNSPEPMPAGNVDMGEPDGMAQDFGGDMGDIQVDKEDEKGDSEIDSIFSKLDTEKQAAVIKYAKSMVSDDSYGNEMPNEDDMVNEICNSVIDDRREKPEEGEDKRIRNKKVTKANPFIAKGFSGNADNKASDIKK